MLEELKKRVYKANIDLVKQGLVFLNWGNASAVDRKLGLMVIKPSGVDYSVMKASDMVVVDINNGKIVEGKYNPSSDTPTHIELYKRHPSICGVVHTHSINATAFAQAGLGIEPLGTTHADCFFGKIPCTRALTKTEIMNDYEKNTGFVINETIGKSNPLFVPSVLVRNHGPFVWGASVEDAVMNAVTLEKIAEINIKTIILSPNSIMDECLLEKHFNRKHGDSAYYGQPKK